MFAAGKGSTGGRKVLPKIKELYYTKKSVFIALPRKERRKDKGRKGFDMTFKFLKGLADVNFGI